MALGQREVAKLFFGKISNDPKLTHLFPFKDDEKRSIKHAMKVVSTLDFAIKQLNDLDTLKVELKELGHTHIGYQVKKEHYPIVTGALRETLAEGLKEEYTAEVKECWELVSTFVADAMISDNYEKHEQQEKETGNKNTT